MSAHVKTMNGPGQLPAHFSEAVAEILAHHFSATAPASELFQLQQWLEDDGRDVLVEHYADAMALDLDSLAGHLFADSEIWSYGDFEDDEQEVTDQLRLEFARRRIAEAFDRWDEMHAPALVCFPLQDEQARVAFLCCRLDFQGQLGDKVTWLGVYSSQQSFYDTLPSCRLFLSPDLISDRDILKGWWRRMDPIYFVEKGNRRSRCRDTFKGSQPLDPKTRSAYSVVITHDPNAPKRFLIEVYSGERFNGRVPAVRHMTNASRRARALARKYASGRVELPPIRNAGPR